MGDAGIEPDTSRSAKAFRAGAALKAGGADYEEMRDALLGHNDPEIAEWARTKGMDNGERELRRIYDRALTAGVISTQAPYDTARAFQRGLAVPLRHHRGDFFEWNGCAWLEVEEASLRARLYAFLDRCKRKTAEGKLLPVKPNIKMVGEVFDALRAAAQLDAAIEPPAWLEGEHLPPAHTLVACANALLHLPSRSCCRTRRRSSITTRSTSTMSPVAPEPRQWLDFLHQLWGDDHAGDRHAAGDFRLLPDRRHEPAKGVRADRPETQRQGHHRPRTRRMLAGPQLRGADTRRASARTSGSRR